MARKPVAPLPGEIQQLESLVPKAPPLPVGKPPVSLSQQAAGVRPAGGPSTIPPILLEGDEPSAPPAAAHARLPHPEEPSLPESYGTGKLLLAAREPHWLYVWWDLSAQQQRGYNARSAEGHLVVRVRSSAAPGQPAVESHVHPESRHWFVHVDRAGTEYVAELGFYAPKHQWVPITTSTPARTPPDAVSGDQTLVFATVPAQARLTNPAAPPGQVLPDGLPPAQAARERASAPMVALQAEQPGGTMSAELTDLARGQAGPAVSSAQITSLAPLLGEAEVTSPMGVAEQLAPGFWFSVNADVVVYGATESDATVTIGGQPIQLRPDGTFSCRFALPDGEHEVTVSAMSAQGDLRQAKLRFSRGTEYRGEVGVTPQDPALSAPAGETA